MYFSNKHVAKITPVKQNNFFDNRFYIVRQLKPLFIIEALFGISRIYLLKPKKIWLWISYCYSFLTILLLTYSLFRDNYYGTAYTVVKSTSCIEYTILVFSSILLQRQTIRDFFKNLEDFDRVLNIDKDVGITAPIYRTYLWIASSAALTITEFVIVHQSSINYSFTSLTILAHDAEQLFFGTMLRTILIRVRVLKAHVIKVCNKRSGEARKREISDKIEALSKKCEHGLSSLHEVYESLHKCSEQLNAFMSFPIMTMMLTSGLSSIILLKYAFTILQSNEQFNDRMLFVYILLRCFKYTFLVVVPCYFSSKTTTQVSIIRKTLHDALNNDQFDKLECRRLKAFFQLTRDSEFAYALWGVINLNMSLPLSYVSLCTTYLVIIIQFSKFID